jgi:hypothetical protein
MPTGAGGGVGESKVGRRLRGTTATLQLTPWRREIDLCEMGLLK